MRILVLHGPNLELLGRREPGYYGAQTLEEIDAALTALGREFGVDVETAQYADEEAYTRAVAETPGRFDGLIVNPACYTHTSTRIAAALAAAGLPYVEVHLSNPYAREEFRTRSHVAAGALGRVMGFKGDSYLLALRGLIAHLQAGRR